MKWYAVQAFSNYENRVKMALEERIKQAGMEEFFGEILIPKESVQENRGGAKRVVTRNFMPGYIFVQMELNDESWHLVKATPRVSGFIGGRVPTPVHQREIERVVQQVAEGAVRPKPSVQFVKGDQVLIVDGALKNHSGAVEEVNEEKQKVRVLISMFGRSTAVELDYRHVEKTN